MADIAREAGVARSTVSAILANSDYCYASEKKRQAVHEAAQRLGYRPNFLARGLAGQRTNCIGYIAENLKGPVLYIHRIASVERACSDCGYRLLVGCHAHQVSSMQTHLSNFLSQHVDGLVIHHSEPEASQVINAAVADGVPIITIDAAELTDAPDIMFDREESGYLQVQHLLALGRRRILFLIGGGAAHYDQAKIRGHHRALQQAGLDPQQMHWLYLRKHLSSDRASSGVALMEDALEKGWKFDAIVATSDMIAAGAMHLLRDQGLRVPQDVAVVGFNDEPIAEAAAVPLTTIRQPPEIGQKAAEMLMRCIEDDAFSPSDLPARTYVPAKLIVRASTAGRDSTEEL